MTFDGGYPIELTHQVWLGRRRRTILSALRSVVRDKPFPPSPPLNFFYKRDSLLLHNVGVCLVSTERNPQAIAENVTDFASLGTCEANLQDFRRLEAGLTLLALRYSRP